jgi:uncharacterized protein
MRETLIDAGPLIAIGDESEGKAHLLCAQIFESDGGLFVTTLPCLTEAMYFLGESKGWRGQEKLWQLIVSEALAIYDLTAEDLKRMNLLMEKYNDTPMDFADASLVAAAESLNVKRIFTLDADFYVYRINDTESFEIIP